MIVAPRSASEAVHFWDARSYPFFNAACGVSGRSGGAASVTCLTRWTTAGARSHQRCNYSGVPWQVDGREVAPGPAALAPAGVGVAPRTGMVLKRLKKGLTKA